METPSPLGETLQALLARLEIEAWDLLLVGDGSGSKWDYPCGWACTALEHDSLERKAFYGAMNDGTVNIAELMAYLAPLSWYTTKVDAQRKASGDFRVRQIHIITDSSYTQGRGEAKDAVTMKRNAILWGAFALIERRGFHLHWHWMEREEAALNRFADALSRAARMQIQAFSLLPVVAESTGLDPHNCNPWE